MNENIPFPHYTIVADKDMHNSEQVQIWRETLPQLFALNNIVERHDYSFNSVLEKAIECDLISRPGRYLVVFPEIGAKILEVEEIPNPRLRIKQ